MELTLESLGLSREDITERVVNQLANAFLYRKDIDVDGEETEVPSTIKQKLDKVIKDRIDAGIEQLADKYIIPNAESMIENITLQKTNEWGQAKKDEKPLTFIEYLIQRAEFYMDEPVDYFGKTKKQGDYNWRAGTTRISYLVDSYLQSRIETAMKEILKDANNILVGGIKKAVEMKLAEVQHSLKVNVTTK